MFTPGGGGGAPPAPAAPAGPPPQTAPMAAPGGGGGAGGGPKRQSVVLQPMAGGMGLVDFDSDYESDEDDAPKAAPADPNHRPMVGGFAAAAYEAARAYHMAHKDKGKKGGPPPPPPPKRGSGRSPNP